MQPAGLPIPSPIEAEEALASAIAEVERARAAAAALRQRKPWGEELKRLEEVAFEAARRVTALRRSILRAEIESGWRR